MSAATVAYEVKSVRVTEFKNGPRAGQQKPIRLPKDAIPLGVTSGYSLRVYYLVPVKR